MSVTTPQKNNGFTLIELMVAVSIFAVVMLIAMGSVLTIVDSNRKARTLTEVMGNLNFSLESMTRAIKTGVNPGYNVGSGVLSVTAIDFSEGGFVRTLTCYQRQTDSEGRGYLARSVGGTGGSCNTEWVPITSELVDIELMEVTVAGIVDFNQPRTQITMRGVVSVTEDISSSFTIQTTISQRKLNLADDE